LKLHTLEERHAQRQDNAHDPELSAALIKTIQRIRNEDQHKVDVQREYSATYCPETP
jgi:hypothetical protein